MNAIFGMQVYHKQKQNRTSSVTSHVPNQMREAPDCDNVLAGQQ